MSRIITLTLEQNLLLSAGSYTVHSPMTSTVPLTEPFLCCRDTVEFNKGDVYMVPYKFVQNLLPDKRIRLL